MNKFYIAFLIAVSFFLYQQAYSQQPVHFTTGNFIPATNTRISNTADLGAALFSGHYYVLIQFDKIPSDVVVSNNKTNLFLNETVDVNSQIGRAHV